MTKVTSFLLLSSRCRAGSMLRIEDNRGVKLNNPSPYSSPEGEEIERYNGFFFIDWIPDQVRDDEE